MNSIKKSLLVLLFFLILASPSVSQAQFQNEEEYRTYLFTVVADLQAQIIELQKAKTFQPIKTTKKDFDSFLIDDTKDIKARYKIASVNDVNRIQNDIHKKYFNRFFELVPNTFDHYFVDLLVYEERGNDFDGFVETVAPYQEDTWRIGISESMFDFSASSSILEELFIHEFGHIISYEGILGKVVSSQAQCHEYFVDYGCPPNDAYLLEFIDEFWTDNDLDALIEFGDDIWLRQEIRDNFVTDYAATSPAEDFAESFTLFVLENSTKVQKIKDEKVNFFYQFDSLVDMRDEIRKKL